MPNVWGHFKRHEFECNHGCGFDTVDAELLSILNEVREHFNVPVNITGPNRCPEHNAKIGGSKKSQHQYARAADFMVVGIQPERVYAFLDQKFPNQYGIGIYSNRVHFDTRSGPPARWDER
jgi:uncharacterized protein YcbK (DUF882 family)